MSTPASSPPARFAAAAITVLFLVTMAAACGGAASDERSSSAEATTSVASAEGTETSNGTSGGSLESAGSPDAPSGSADLDLCAEVTAEDVGAVLTEAEISDAAPNPALDVPSCQYFVAWAGTPLSVVQITWNETGFLDALRQSNPTATDLSGVGDGVAISEDSIVVAGRTGDFQVDGGVELAEGGSVATQEQLVALAQMVEDQ